MIFKCKQCNKEFKRYLSKANIEKGKGGCCSRDCFNTYMIGRRISHPVNNKTTKFCEICKKEFKTYRVERSKFCSKKCLGISNGLKRLGKPRSEATKQKIRDKRAEQVFSIEDRKKMSISAKNKPKVTTKTRIRMSLSSRRGKENNMWKGGITPKNQKIRTSLEYKLWREAVYKRDDFTCQECNDSTGGNLEAHHVKPFSLYPELRFAIDNGVTLCKKCHEKTDSYGSRIITYKTKQLCQY